MGKILFSNAFLSFILTLSFSSCAHKNNKINLAVDKRVESVFLDDKIEITETKCVDILLGRNIVQSLSGLPVIKDLPSFSNITINVKNAFVYIKSTKEIKKNQGQLLVQKRDNNNKECSVEYVSKNQDSLAVTSSHDDCTFDISLFLREAGKLNITMQKGNILLENWEMPTQLKLLLGDIDFLNLGDLDVECESCMLSGSGLLGELKYKIKNGNVGIEDLNSTVIGQTFGDVVLKWKNMKGKPLVRLVSQAGDVFLQIPKHVSLFLDLKAPRGEIYSKSNSTEHGHPIAVTAEIGNVKLVQN